MNNSLKQKEQNAISVLRSFEPKSGEGYYLCYSGGKDSDCIRILAALAGVKHDVVHNLTTVDAPETVYYVRSIPGVDIKQPPKTMWRLIVEKRMPPTRPARYCCEELKERGGRGRLKVTGVRHDESANRKESADLVRILGKPKTVQKAATEMGADFNVTKQQGLIMNHDNDPARRLVEHCYRTTSTMSGFKGMKREFAAYPKYRANYVRAFDRMLKKRIEDGIPATGWETGEDVMRWWVGDDPNQYTLFDLEGTG